MTVFLVFTRTGCRTVKRRPYPEPGEWVVEVRVKFPPPNNVPVLTLDLMPEPELLSAELVGQEVSAPELEPEPAEP